MDYKEYYQSNHTYITFLDARLNKIVSLSKQLKPRKLLDIGCGEGTLLGELSNQLPKTALFGTDVYEQKPKKWAYKISDITTRINFDDDTFDVVVIGEVIEHVPDPDFVFAEIKRILKPGGSMIVTTPNLASWTNRILLLFGIQPLFTETSTKQNVGRIFSFLGQGRKTQGHLKVFTKRSLKETIELNNLAVTKIAGSTFFFPKPINLIDKLFSNVPSLASNLVMVARKHKR